MYLGTVEVDQDDPESRLLVLMDGSLVEAMESMEESASELCVDDFVSSVRYVTQLFLFCFPRGNGKVASVLDRGIIPGCLTVEVGSSIIGGNTDCDLVECFMNIMSEYSCGSFKIFTLNG